MKDTRFLRCWNCGFPRAIGYFFRWYDDGTISPFMTRELRAVILHADMINNLFSDIEQRFGISIEKAAFNAQRSVMRLMLPVLTEKIKVARYMLDFFPVRGGGMTTFLAVVRRGGFGAGEVIQYRSGRYMTVSIKNPFNLNLVAAMIVSAAEFFEGNTFNYYYEKKSENEYIMRLDVASRKPGDVEPAQLGSYGSISGGQEQRRCTNCDVPLGVSAHFEARESEGLIIDRHTESRVIFMEGRILLALFREISKEIGVEQIQLLSETFKRWTVENMGLVGLKARIHPLSGEYLEREFDKKLMDLPVFGLGCATEAIISRSGVRVVILNSFNNELIGGMLTGAFEVLTGNRGRMTWEDLDGGKVAFTVK